MLCQLPSSKAFLLSVSHVVGITPKSILIRQVGANFFLNIIYIIIDRAMPVRCNQVFVFVFGVYLIVQSFNACRVDNRILVGLEKDDFCVNG